MQPFLRLSSVRVRLTLWNVAVLALALLVFGGAVRYVLQASLSMGAQRRLAHQVALVEASPPVTGAQSPASPPNMGGLLPPGQRPLRPAVLTMQGEPFNSLWYPTPPWDPKTLADAYDGHETYSAIHRGRQVFCILSRPLIRAGMQIGVIQAVTPVTDDDLQVSRITKVLLTLIPLALLAAGGGGAFLTGRALRPVRQISHAASRIEAADLSGRLPVTGNDELAELAATFNAMLARLEDAFTRLTEANERQRRFTADASHELRTPLTVIKANTSLALMVPRAAAEYRVTLEAVDRSADRMEKIVHDLLLLARVDAKQLHLRPKNLAVQGVLEAAQNAFVPPGSATVRVEVSPYIHCIGDADSLTRLFGNLLFNAVQHTPPDGKVVVTAADDGSMVLVQVQDTGEGIAPEHLPHLGERFYRVDAARSSDRGGTGLGLAICKGIAEAHGGSLDISSEMGHGTTVSITLPSAAKSEAETISPSLVLHNTLVI